MRIPRMDKDGMKFITLTPKNLYWVDIYHIYMSPTYAKEENRAKCRLIIIYKHPHHLHTQREWGLYYVDHNGYNTILRRTQLLPLAK